LFSRLTKVHENKCATNYNDFTVLMIKIIVQRHRDIFWVLYVSLYSVLLSICPSRFSVQTHIFLMDFQILLSFYRNMYVHNKDDSVLQEYVRA